MINHFSNLFKAMARVFTVVLHQGSQVPWQQVVNLGHRVIFFDQLNAFEWRMNDGF